MKNNWWEFVKAVASGNDFILFDATERNFPFSKQLVQKLCQRQKGIGADGVIVYTFSHSADYTMRIFNADGSEAEMCGNGLRCLSKLIHTQTSQKSFSIQSKAGILKVKIEDPCISIEMGKPNEIRLNETLRIEDQDYLVHYMDTGVPHAVLFFSEIEAFDLNSWAPKLRYHAHYSPRGVNVNIASIENNKIKLRTYERGVEAETLACGTGAAAAALAAALTHKIPSPIFIDPPSKEQLEISFDAEFSNITLKGNASLIYYGSILLD